MYKNKAQKGKIESAINEEAIKTIRKHRQSENEVASLGFVPMF